MKTIDNFILERLKLNSDSAINTHEITKYRDVIIYIKKETVNKFYNKNLFDIDEMIQMAQLVIHQCYNMIKNYIFYFFCYENNDGKTYSIGFSIYNEKKKIENIYNDTQKIENIVLANSKKKIENIVLADNTNCIGHIICDYLGNSSYINPIPIVPTIGLGFKFIPTKLKHDKKDQHLIDLLEGYVGNINQKFASER